MGSRSSKVHGYIYRYGVGLCLFAFGASFCLRLLLLLLLLLTEHGQAGASVALLVLLVLVLLRRHRRRQRGLPCVDLVLLAASVGLALSLVAHRVGPLLVLRWIRVQGGQGVVILYRKKIKKGKYFLSLPAKECIFANQIFVAVRLPPPKRGRHRYGVGGGRVLSIFKKILFFPQNVREILLFILTAITILFLSAGWRVLKFLFAGVRKEEGWITARFISERESPLLEEAND